MSKAMLVFCACPDRPTALRLAESLVNEGLAACVSIKESITSVYIWQGQLEQAEECLLMAKTSARRYQDLEDAIRARHPYELPEIVAVPIQSGLNEYLDWIDTCTNDLP